MTGFMMKRRGYAGLCLATALLASCSATQETASPWAKSPNGEWLTRIARSDTAGPGINFLAETVQIKRANADETVDLLTLVENDGGAKIRLWWRDPTHLVIGYLHAEVTFQAIKLGELSIETRELAR